MAKKKAKKPTPAQQARKAKLTAKDKKTLNSLVGMADGVVRQASRGRALRTLKYHHVVCPT